MPNFIQNLFNQSNIFSKKSLSFTFYLFPASCFYSHQFKLYEKQNSNVSIFVLLLPSSLYFSDSVRYNNFNFKFHCFQHTVLNLLKQSRLDFSNPKQTFARIQLLEIDCRRSLFSDIICDKRH